MNELTIIKKNGGAYIDSREVAEAIGKDHRHLLRDIRGYASVINKLGAPNLGLTNYFVESTYVDTWNREKPCFLLTKMGCEMVANKLTGEKGVLFTAAYVKRFNAMETAEREAEIKSHARPRLSEFNSAVRNVLGGMSYCNAKPERVMGFLRGVYEPLGVQVRNNRDDTEYYTATVIAMSLGMYSASGNPHAHAVSAIISKIDNWQSHAIAVPYGLVGVSVRYDLEVARGVLEWVIDRDRPRSIPYLGFEYHVYYRGDLPALDEDEDDYALYLYEESDGDEYTAEELDAMCGNYGECDDCPGFTACCNEF